MKELIYTAPSELEWREGAEPAITGPEQALVHPVASAFCDPRCFQCICKT